MDHVEHKIGCLTLHGVHLRGGGQQKQGSSACHNGIRVIPAWGGGYRSSGAVGGSDWVTCAMCSAKPCAYILRAQTCAQCYLCARKPMRMPCAYPRAKGFERVNRIFQNVYHGWFWSFYGVFGVHLGPILLPNTQPP